MISSNAIAQSARILSLACVVCAAGTAAGANLVTDPGFELNPVTTAVNSLGNFPGFQGVWGQENSTIVGVDGGSTPYAGRNQLRMDVTGGVTTQAFQSIDVSSYAGIIDANNAVLTASAWFNSNSNNALGGVYISYFTGNTYGTLFGPLDTAVATFDNSAATWQQNSLTVPVPAGTRWILFQVAFAESTLYDSAGTIGSGYVDEAFAEINPVPAPAGALVLGVGGLALCRRRR
jgi:hypothetical protein